MHDSIDIAIRLVWLSPPEVCSDLNEASMVDPRASGRMPSSVLLLRF